MKILVFTILIIGFWAGSSVPPQKEELKKQI